MFGLFKKDVWRPVVMLGVDVGEVVVGSETDEIFMTLEQVVHELQRKIDVLNQQADARFKDTQALFKLARINEPESMTILITKEEADALRATAVSGGAGAKRGGGTGKATSTKSKPRKVVKRVAKK